MIRSCVELLKGGNVEPLHFGDDRATALRLLGMPDDEYKDDNAGILKYGQWQFFFEYGRLTMVVCVLNTPMNFTLNGNVSQISSKTTIEEFIGICETLDISWAINQELTFDRQMCISTNSSTNVFFDLDRKKLAKIQVTVEM